MSEFKDEEIDIDDLLGEEFEQPKVAGQNIEHAPNPTEVGEANNVFAGIEKHLKLPLGSTKEGIKAAKEESKKIIDNAKTVTAQANIIKSKESINDNLPVPRYDAETLAMIGRKLGNVHGGYMKLASGGSMYSMSRLCILLHRLTKTGVLRQRCMIL